jgi:hypothetical protein
VSTRPGERCGARGSAIALTLLVAFSSACSPPDAKSPAPANRKDTANMQSTQTAVDALSRIPEARLLADPSDATEAAYDALQGVTFDGIAVRAQAVVAKDRVPVLVCIAQSAARSNEVPAGDNAVIIVNRVDGAGAWSVPLYPARSEKIPRRAPSAPPPPPAGGEAAQPLGSTAVQYLDLGSAQGMRWEAGSYALRVISYDWRSNTVPIQMRDAAAPAASQDQAAREAQRLKFAQSGRGAADSLPHFVRSARSPALEGTGIAAAFPEAAAASGATLPVYGTVRLPPKPARGDGPIAVETGYIVLARRGSLAPIALPLDVPLYAGSGAMEGYFAYDLSKLAANPLPPAEYAAYFVLGEHTAGPYRIAIR